MTEVLLVIVTVLAGIAVILLLILLSRNPVAKLSNVESRLEGLDKSIPGIQQTVREEISKNREESSTLARQGREELNKTLTTFSESILSRMTEIATLQKNQLDSFSQQINTLTQSNDQKLNTIKETIEQKLTTIQTDSNISAKTNRDELGNTLKLFRDSIMGQMTEIASLQKNQLDTFSTQITTMTKNNDEKQDKLRVTVETRLTQIQTDNNEKLEKMRQTVDEKLHATLEKRLGESFKLVSDRLELVHKGLGEMQTLASGVGDLKKVLTNVRTRGTWGEIQLGNLLEQIFTPEQYEKNVKTKPSSNEFVEYAIKLPGRDESVVWLPIDSKYSAEDYQRLLDAQEQANPVLVEESARQLENTIKLQAKSIRDKYLAPPNTTDFAILFLPIEALYAEVLRRPGLCEKLQNEYRVIITCPTTLAALLNSLQMGFRTLAVEKRSSEVWSLLGAVKQNSASSVTYWIRPIRNYRKPRIQSKTPLRRLVRLSGN